MTSNNIVTSDDLPNRFCAPLPSWILSLLGKPVRVSKPFIGKYDNFQVGDIVYLDGVHGIAGAEVSCSVFFREDDSCLYNLPGDCIERVI